MTSLKEQLESYGAYHRDPRNKLTHFVGVPLVTFSIFLVLSWFRFIAAPELPVTGACSSTWLCLRTISGSTGRWHSCKPPSICFCLVWPTAPHSCRFASRSPFSSSPSSWVGPFNCWAMPSRDAARRWPTTCSRSSMRPLPDRRGPLSLRFAAGSPKAKRSRGFSGEMTHHGAAFVQDDAHREAELSAPVPGLLSPQASEE